MRTWLFLTFIAALVVSCGDNEVAEETLDFDSYEKKLSYSLGAAEGKRILETPAFNADRLNKELLISGFRSNFSKDQPSDCESSLNNLYGESGMDFNENYINEGSSCIGRITAYGFYNEFDQVDKISQLDTAFLFAGFAHALNEKDTTFLSEIDQSKILQEFFEGVNERIKQEMAMRETPIWEEIMAKANVKEIEAGVWLETIQEGKGGSPNPGDDVQADYILMSLHGDTLQSSFDRKLSPEPVDAPAFNLNMVYEGWRVSFPHMKKGGKYQIYLPYSAVMDQRLPDQSYTFYIEFLDYGPANTLAKPMY